PEDITRAPRLSVHRISESGAERLDAVPRTFYVPTAASRAARATMRLRWLLAAKSGRFDVAIVRKPPAPPAGLPAPVAARARAVLLALVAARARGARVIVDWHGHTAAMLALSLGCEHEVVWAVNRAEAWLARRASAHFAVSDAMREYLRARFGIDAAVLHDRPR